METVVDLNPDLGSSSLKGLAARSLRVLFDPARFFRQELPQFSVSDALAFGIGNAWLAAVIAFFIQTINSLILSQLLDRWMQRLVASEDGFLVWSLSATSFLWTSGAILLGPFLFLLRAFLSSVGLFLFARLLIEDRQGAPEAVSFQGVFRIQAISLLSQWFGVVPIFGPLLSFLVSLILSVTGVRERYQTSTRRAVAVVLGPYLMFFVALLLLGVLFMVALSQFSFQDLLDLDPGILGG